MEAVDLLGVDRVNLEAAFEQDLDNGVMRRLNRHGDRRRLGAARRHQPIAHLCESFAAVRKGSLADNLAAQGSELGLTRVRELQKRA